MKKLIKSICFLALIFTGLNLLGANFDGSIKMKISSSGGPTAPTSANMMMFIKGSNLAFQILDGNFGDDMKANMMKDAKFVVDGTQQMIYIMMDMGGQKMGMKMDMKKLEQQEIKMSETQKKEAEIKFNPTGKSKIINGFNCAQFLGENEKTKTEMWVTNDLGINSYDFYNKFSKSFKQDLVSSENLKNVKGFPIQTITTDKTNKMITTSEIVEVKNGNVPENTFSISGYDFMDMSSLMPQK